MLAGAPQALRGRRAHGECGRGTLLLAGGFLLLLQAPSAVRAACSPGLASQSNFQLSFVEAGSTPNKACFKLASDASCNAADSCCLPATTKIKSMQLELSGDKALSCTKTRLKRKHITVMRDSTTLRAPSVTRSGKLDLRVSGTVPAGGTTICIDTTVNECTIAELCGGSSCKLKINTGGAPRTAGVTAKSACCLDGETTITGVAGNTSSTFNIKLVNVGNNKVLDDLFEAAAQVWENIIKVDLPAVQASNIDLSGGEFKPFTYTWGVDDIIIFFKTGKIDGKNQILGYAGPLYVRDDGSALPVSGLMVFDQADVDVSTDAGKQYWADVIKHEMGHVLGIGTLWTDRGCESGCQPNSAAGTMNYYKCPAAQREYAATAGCTGQLPIETEAGAGSACGHWREDTLSSELMTPYAEPVGTPMPISRITIGALEDLYGNNSVNYDFAQPFKCPPPSKSASLQARAAVSKKDRLLPFRLRKPIGRISLGSQPRLTEIAR